MTVAICCRSHSNPRSRAACSAETPDGVAWVLFRDGGRNEDPAESGPELRLNHPRRETDQSADKLDGSENRYAFMERPLQCMHQKLYRLCCSLPYAGHQLLRSLSGH